jgi:hypothetical protein
MLDLMRRSLLLVFLVACGGSVDLADYIDSAVDARCEYLVRCGLFENTSSCHAYYDGRVPQNPSIEAAVDAGKMTYDGEAANDCFDALASASCSRDAELSDTCDHIFAGKVADGAACAFDAECVSDNCAVSDCVMACCPGTCSPARPVPKIGEQCNFVCEDGAYCALDSTCKAVLPKGASCDYPLACDRGLYCAGVTSMTAGTCTATPKTGQSCTDLCDAIGDDCTNGTCKPVGLLGDSCTSDNDCSSYYECDASQHCAEQMATPAMPNGSTCSSSIACQSHYCGNDNLCADVPTCI